MNKPVQLYRGLLLSLRSLRLRARLRVFNHLWGAFRTPTKKWDSQAVVRIPAPVGKYVSKTTYVQEYVRWRGCFAFVFAAFGPFSFDALGCVPRLFSSRAH